MGAVVSIPEEVNRIISLVPSQTELLFDLGLGHKVVGITKFCVHPEGEVKNTEKIGGTKKFNFEKIQSLRPDLIIANKEENYKEGIEQLRSKYPVWVSDIFTLEDAFNMILEVGKITQKTEQAKRLVGEIELGFEQVTTLDNPTTVAYLIWNKPTMAAGGQTFIDHLLRRLGFHNVFSQITRYPEIDPELESSPDYIFLSSEPFPFREKHISTYKTHFAKSKIKLVDGEFFSWYGSRLRQAPKYFRELITEINAENSE